VCCSALQFVPVFCAGRFCKTQSPKNLATQCPRNLGSLELVDTICGLPFRSEYRFAYASNVILQNTSTYCNTLLCIPVNSHATKNCSVLHHTAIHCYTLQYNVLHSHRWSTCITLQPTALYSQLLKLNNSLLHSNHTATHCNTQNLTNSYCCAMSSTLATPCNTLQYPATHYHILHCLLIDSHLAHGLLFQGKKFFRTCA